MSTVIELPLPPRETPQVTRKAGFTMLEFMQASRGIPYHAPTVQFRALRRGAYTDYEPINPLATLMAKLAGRLLLSEGHLVLIEEMGISVERHS